MGACRCRFVAWPSLRASADPAKRFQLTYDGDVRLVQEQVDAIESSPIHDGFRGERQHFIERNTWVSAKSTFADDARPRRVV